MSGVTTTTSNGDQTHPAIPAQGVPGVVNTLRRSTSSTVTHAVGRSVDSIIIKKTRIESPVWRKFKTCRSPALSGSAETHDSDTADDDDEEHQTAAPPSQLGSGTVLREQQPKDVGLQFRASAQPNTRHRRFSETGAEEGGGGVCHRYNLCCQSFSPQRREEPLARMTVVAAGC